MSPSADHEPSPAGTGTPSPSDDERVITLESSDKVTYHLFAHECLASRLIQDAIDNDEEDIDVHVGVDSYSDTATFTCTDQDQNHTIETSASTSPDCRMMMPSAPTTSSTVIPLANVRSDCLAQVVRFMKHHAIEPLHPIQLKLQTHPQPQHPNSQPNTSGSSTTNRSSHTNISNSNNNNNNTRENAIDEIVTQEWYRCFIKEMPREMVFQIVNAANYMDIPTLLNLSCLKVSVDLMDKSAEDIRKVLNLPKMTEEEERKAREEHSWIFEG